MAKSLSVVCRISKVNGVKTHTFPSGPSSEWRRLLPFLCFLGVDLVHGADVAVPLVSVGAAAAAAEGQLQEEGEEEEGGRGDAAKVRNGLVFRIKVQIQSRNQRDQLHKKIPLLPFFSSSSSTRFLFPDFKARDLINSKPSPSNLSYEGDLRIPDSGSLVRGASVDDTNSVLVIRDKNGDLTATTTKAMATFRTAQVTKRSFFPQCLRDTKGAKTPSSRSCPAHLESLPTRPRPPFPDGLTQASSSQQPTIPG